MGCMCELADAVYILHVALVLLLISVYCDCVCDIFFNRTMELKLMMWVILFSDSVGKSIVYLQMPLIGNLSVTVNYRTNVIKVVKFYSPAV